MGREIKRVPVDFDWPKDKVWHGYLQPESLRELPCPAGDECANGVTTARAWVDKVCYLLLMLNDDRNDQARGRPLHPYFDSIPRPYLDSHGSSAREIRPSADIQEFGEGLAGRGNRRFGHDAVDHWVATKKVIAAAGLNPETWGICPSCKGHATIEAYEGQRADQEAWTETEPPEGDGWQLWETVSEGSHISPVFADAEGLARWLTTPAACWGAMRTPMSIEAARGFVGAGWAPSMIADDSGLHDGATFVGERARD